MLPTTTSKSHLPLLRRVKHQVSMEHEGMGPFLCCHDEVLAIEDGRLVTLQAIDVGCTF